MFDQTRYQRKCQRRRSSLTSRCSTARKPKVNAINCVCCHYWCGTGMGSIPNHRLLRVPIPFFFYVTLGWKKVGLYATLDYSRDHMLFITRHFYLGQGPFSLAWPDPIPRRVWPRETRGPSHENDGIPNKI